MQNPRKLPPGGLDRTSSFLDSGFDDFAQKLGFKTGKKDANRARTSFSVPLVGRLNFSDQSGSEEGEDEIGRPPSSKIKCSVFNQRPQRDEDHFKLINAKSQAAIFETSSSDFKRKFEEEKIDNQRNKQQHKHKEEQTERRCTDAKKAYLSELSRNKESQVSALSAQQVLVNKNQELSNEIIELRENLTRIVQSNSEDESNLKSQVDHLTTQLMEERRQRAKFEMDVEHFERELEGVRNRNAVLIQTETKALEDFANAEMLRTEAVKKLRLYENECQEAMGRREELKTLKQLIVENENIKRQIIHFKTISENTLLLKEEKLSLEETVDNLRIKNSAILKENNEIKVAIARNSRNEDSNIRLVNIDSISEQLVEYSQKNVDLKKELNSTLNSNREIQAKTDKLQMATEEKISNLEDRLYSQSHECNRMVEQMKKVDTECQCLLEKLSQKDTLLTELTLQLAEKHAKESNNDMEEMQRKLVEKEHYISTLEEQLHGKGDFNPDTTKVLHLESNPLESAHFEYLDKIAAIEAENERLLIRLDEFNKCKVSGNIEAELSLDLTERVGIRLEELKFKQEILENEKSRSREIQSQVARKYREMCTLLTGFQFKMKDENSYQVESVYDRPGSFFLFQVHSGVEEWHFDDTLQKSEQGQVQLLESDCATQWTDFIESYLTTDECIPAFLAAVTLQLYNQEGTVVIDKREKGHDEASSSF